MIPGLVENLKMQNLLGWLTPDLRKKGVFGYCNMEIVVVHNRFAFVHFPPISGKGTVPQKDSKLQLSCDIWELGHLLGQR